MTEKIIIRYKDSEGTVTERGISDICHENSETVEAFCQLRQERRSFKMDRIIRAVKAETGEVIENHWAEFSLSMASDGRERLESITIKIIPAIKALKYFSLQIRGFAKRERTHILTFIKENSDISQYSAEELEEWLYKLWVGDIYTYRKGNHSEYKQLLREIPHSLIEKAHTVAIAIAGGSGRRRMPQEMLERINSDYAEK